MEYTGEVISQAEKNSSLRGIGQDGDVYFQEFYDYPQQSVIDSQLQGNPAWFISHICGEANLKFATWWTEGVPCCALVAQTPIAPGDEYLASYNMIQDSLHNS
eukprot:3940583-Rhodomonas_salina.2